ncbi:exo-alpha-sialidase [Parabacteroides sp.]
MKKILLLISLSILLFSCTSYTDGIYVTVKQPVLPVLTMKETNPVLKIELIRTQPIKYSLREITLELQGTTEINDIDKVGLYHANAKGMIDTDKPLLAPIAGSETVTFNTDIQVETDTFSLWVSLKLKNKIDLSHRFNVTCVTLKTDKGKIKVPETPSTGLRAGVAVRQHMQDGVHTSRIPGLATSSKGTLLAIYDARHESSRDLQGDMDIYLNRSTDGGQTWQPIQTVLDMKEWGGLPEKYNGVSDANILVDENTGDIYVAGLWMHGVLDGKTGKWVPGMTKDSTRWMHQWREKGSQPGFGVKETSQFLITKSTDDGLTWSEPVNITAQTKRKEWWLYAPAPGHGITLKDGTLVFPTQGRDKEGHAFSNITWSKDGGKTWTASNPAFGNVTECMAVQLSDGSIMLNMRDNRNRGNKEVNGRRICVTSNLGQTWTEHPTSRKALIEPTCMASIHKHTYQHDGIEKSILLFVNPESYSERNHITLKVSYDDGNTWPDEKKILLDEYNGRGYSCITSVDESTIGILYESSQADMVFQQVKLDEILP